MGVEWSKIFRLMEVSAMLYKCTYWVFTLNGTCFDPCCQHACLQIKCAWIHSTSTNIHVKSHWPKLKWMSDFNPSSLKGELQQPPKQFSSWCLKIHSNGGKLIWVSLSLSFLFILAKKKKKVIKPITYPMGRVSFQHWEAGGSWCNPMIL